MTRTRSSQQQYARKGSAASNAASHEAQRLSASGIAPIGDGRRNRRKNNFGAGSLSRDPDKEILRSDDEFPLLRRMGLYASGIEGDGNCLFRSLSDQLYGDGGEDHLRIRSQIVEYMRENSGYFSMFLGGTRGGSWEGYLNRMARDGVYGDNPEIVAFANCYRVNVVIYQSDNLFVVACQDAQSCTPTTHIAYHEWEHYSSVRNRSGPHKGLPEVEPKEPVGSLDGLQGPTKNSDPAPAYKVKVVKSALPFVLSDGAIVDALKEHSGSISDTVEALLLSDMEGELSPAGEDRRQASLSSEAAKPPPPLQAPIVRGRRRSSVTFVEPATEEQSKPAAPKPAVTTQKRLTAREKKEKQKREALERKKAQRLTATKSNESSVSSKSKTKEAASVIPNFVRAGIKAIHI